MKFAGVAAFAVVFATKTLAICSGYDYAIGNKIPIGYGFSRWNVYDDSCLIVDELVTDGNADPCDQGIFSCSSSPIIFDKYTNHFTHLTYTCSNDSNSEACGGDAISVCCLLDKD